MRKIKFLITSLLVLTFIACADDDNSTSFVDDVAAPANLAVSFSITQDNTGLVTLTPNAEGATEFELGFGDGSGTVVTLNPGESVEHVYSEGTYQIPLLARGINGLTTEITQPLMVSFVAPTNLVIDAVIDAANPFQVNISATADFASSFQVYFDTSNPDEDPTPMGLEETVSFIYPMVGDYTARVVALSGGTETTEGTADITISAPTELPIDFEAFDTSAYIGFGGCSGDVIANPDTNGNSSATVARVVKNGPEVWAGNVITASAPIDFSSEQVIQLDVWSPRPGGRLLFKVENLDNAGIFVEHEVVLTGNSAWEEVSIDFSDVDQAQTYQKLVWFFDFGDVGDGSSDWTFYVDNIRQTNASSPEIPIDFESGAIEFNVFSFGGSLGAVIDNPDASGINTSSRVFEINKTSGAQVWAGAGFGLIGPIDFSAGTTVTMDVWSPNAGTPFLFKIEDSNSPPDGNGNPSVVAEILATTTVAGGWETLSFDLTAFGAFDASNSYDTIVLFANFGNNGTGTTYYLDNIQLTN